MAYCNTAPGKKATPLAEDTYHADTPLEQYDLNFSCPVRVLESNGVRLEPFIPSIHAKDTWAFFSSKAGEEIYTYLPFSRPNSMAAFLTLQESRRRDTGWVDFVIYDKSWSSGPKLAGMISFIHTNVPQFSTEIGAVFIFPDFQRTHINTHATALLLQYGFEELGMRRIQWRANSMNEASVRAAKRFGFTYEGRMNWDRVLPQGNVGHAVSSKTLGSPLAGPGRHSEQLAITWQTWEKSVKENIDELMSREVFTKQG